MKKPELLMPAGNMDTFKAALAGGADAVYLGTKNFNARSRAQNFTWKQLSIAVETAHHHNAKVYVTLNIVIKNKEISELLNTLHILNQIKPDALIIQDWGVFYIAKKFFPKLKLHASTQMAIHNSQGVNYASKLGIKRIILARELTLNELQNIRKETKAEIEIFTHGALCYSFSGMCLYSSFSGGQSANRGLCKQPCRRIFNSKQERTLPFSLKDLETIDLVPQFADIGIDSLKVEGRLKSVNYVYNVARSYRMVIDNPESINEAKTLLEMDMGRIKTSYFLGGNLAETHTIHTQTGIEIGTILKLENKKMSFSSSIPLLKGDRIRVVLSNNTQTTANIGDFAIENDAYIVEKSDEKLQKPGNKVFLTSRKQEKIKGISEVKTIGETSNLGQEQKIRMLKQLQPEAKQKNAQNKLQFYTRISSLKWLRKNQLSEADAIFLQLTAKEFNHLNFKEHFLKKHIHKIHLELPVFVAESNIVHWQEIIKQAKSAGVRRFVISHLCQMDYFQKGDYIISNENVYAFNDAAIKQLQSQNIRNWVYPLESDMENLKSYRHKTGILPIYFKPRLFTSRTPAKIDPDTLFTDDYRLKLRYIKQDNLNYTIPENPVSFTQFVKIFKTMGYNQLLIDLSFESPSETILQDIIRNAITSKIMQPTHHFNMKNNLA